MYLLDVAHQLEFLEAYCGLRETWTVKLLDYNNQ